MKSRIAHVAPIAALLAALACAPLRAAGAEPAAAAIPAASTELVEKAKAFDGSAVSFEGEAIGDPMPRGEGAWINVSDGAYAIGVWLPRPELARIGRYGSYSQKGDRVRITGVFHRACAEHGGDFDIHAISIAVVERGSRVEHPVSRSRLLAAIALVGSGALMLALWLRRRAKDLVRGKPRY